MKQPLLVTVIVIPLDLKGAKRPEKAERFSVPSNALFTFLDAAAELSTLTGVRVAIEVDAGISLDESLLS